ncbi:MAG: hypothetical protein KJ065_07800 [Anaerolineae bacterium]|nr:hypothetical protein [Anaerolineae bacterium]
MHVRVRALLLLLLSLSTAVLGCWSSDTLFIPPTATVPPTDIPPTPDFDSRFQVDDTVVILGEGIAPVYLTENPEPLARRNRVPNAACYPNSTVVIEAVQRVDAVTYYRITCNSLPGWVDESRLGAP